MAQHNVLILNQTVPQIQEPQVGDTYLLPRDVEIQGNLTISGNVDGIDVAAAGALAASATQPGDNLSTLVNDMLASQGEAEAGVDNTKLMTPLRVAQAIAILAAGLKNNFAAVTDPANTDDDTEGYSIGSVWINTLTNEAYRCVDATTNLAVWVNTTVTAADLATVALSGNSDDLTEGATKLLLTVAERAKLAAIESGATADQTGAEIKAALFAETDTNNFDDAYKAKLDALTGLTTGITAFAGGGQGSATQLTTRYNIVETVASVGDSVKLPTANGATVVVVKNIGASSCDVFPQGGESINKLADNAAFVLASDTAKYFFATASDLWETL